MKNLIFAMFFLGGCVHAASPDEVSQEKRGIWLHLGYGDYNFQGSREWNCKKRTFSPLPEKGRPTLLWVQEELFKHAAQKVGVGIEPLKNIKTSDTKKVLNKVLQIFHGKYQCKELYLDQERNQKASDDENILEHLLDGEQFPLQEQGMPQHALHVELSDLMWYEEIVGSPPTWVVAALVGFLVFFQLVRQPKKAIEES